MNAALIYQHRTASRDRAIADALDHMVEVWSSSHPTVRENPRPLGIEERGKVAPQIIRGISVRVLPDSSPRSHGGC